MSGNKLLKIKEKKHIIYLLKHNVCSLQMYNRKQKNDINFSKVLEHNNKPKILPQKMVENSRSNDRKR